MSRPDPPAGYRVATSTTEVFNVGRRRRLGPLSGHYPLRIYVSRRWTPARLDGSILGAPSRPRIRNVPVMWGEYPFGDSRNIPFDRIAIPVEEES